MNDERLLQEISAACNLASLSERVGEPMDLRLRLYSLAIAYADARESKEIAELKATVIQAQQMYTDLLVGTTDAINAKDAEIKLLREFAKQCQKSPEKLVKMNWFEDGSFDYCDLIPLQEAAASVLSPAPVTETKNKEQE